MSRIVLHLSPELAQEMHEAVTNPELTALLARANAFLKESR